MLDVRARRLWLGRLALVLSLALWFVAPIFVANGYHPISQSISESAGQHTPNAWIARTSFVLLGVGAWISWATRPSTTPRRNQKLRTVTSVVRAGTFTFGAGMIAAAIWSHAPWLPGTAGNPTEDTLHSVAAATAGVGIVVAGLAAHWLPHRSTRWRVSTGLCTALFVFVPPATTVLPEIAGILQRVMFAAATIWLLWQPNATTALDPAPDVD